MLGSALHAFEKLDYFEPLFRAGSIRVGQQLLSQAFCLLCMVRPIRSALTIFRQQRQEHLHLRFCPEHLLIIQTQRCKLGT